MDPEFFPSPHEFRPERWLEAKESGFPLHKYLVAFSRGHRQCLGMRYVESRTAAAKR
jgi:cytochrome P450